MRKCSKCKLEKPEEEFHWRNKAKGLRQSRCKPCAIAIVIAAEQAHPERRRETQRRYRRGPAFRATYQRFMATEKGRQCGQRRSANRRARKKDAFVEVVDPMRCFEAHNGLCGICGDPVLANDFHIDHRIPLVKGGEHSYANCQPAHPVCNRLKGSQVSA